MKKKFIIITAILALIVISYSVAWQVVLGRAAAKINSEYANKDIPIPKLANGGERIIRFSSATPSGFPFKWSVQIQGWTEEDKLNKVEFKEPIFIGYNLLTQNVFLRHSGEAYARVKPVETGFGSKITIGDCSLTIKLPLSISLIKMLASGVSDKFEIINYVGKSEFSVSNIQIFDLFDNKLLYDLDHELVEFTFDKSIYYKSLQEFLDHIPHAAEINHSVKVNHSSMSQKILPDNILYGFAWNSAFTSEGKFNLKTGALTFKEVLKDLEIDCPDFKFEDNAFSIAANIFYKVYQPVTNKDITVRLTSKMGLNTGFFVYVRDLLKNRVIYSAIPQRLNEELDYIIKNKNNFQLDKLENRQYESALNLSFIQSTDSLKMTINDFDLFSGKTGIKLRNDTDYNSKSFQWKSHGIMSLNNYPKIVDICSGYVSRFSKLPETLPQVQSIAADVAKYFLKSISDHPTSSSNDLSLTYDLNSSNLAKSKVGTVEFGQIEPLYFLALYRQTAGKIKLDDKIMDRIKELVPILNNQPSILQEIIKKPANIFKKDILKQLIK